MSSDGDKRMEWFASVEAIESSSHAKYSVFDFMWNTCNTCVLKQKQGHVHRPVRDLRGHNHFYFSRMDF